MAEMAVEGLSMSLPKRKAKLLALKYCFFIGTNFNVFVENDARSLSLSGNAI